MDELDRKIKKLIDDNMDITSECIDKIEGSLEGLKAHKIKKTFFIFDKIYKYIVAGIIATSAVSVCAYTGIKVMENKRPEQTISEVQNNGSVVGHIYLEDETIELHTSTINNVDWKWTNTNNYLKITTIEEYNEYKENLKEAFEFIEMTEKDFENENLFIIKLHKNGAYVNDIYADDEITYIEIIEDFNEVKLENQILTIDEYVEQVNEKGQVVLIKFPKSLDRENVRIGEFPLDTFTNEKPIRELVKNGYTKEEAIADGCIVTQHLHDGNECKCAIISNNKEKLDEFIEPTKNGEESSIRIVEYNYPVNHYIDIKYEDGIYKLYSYRESLDNSENSTSYFKQGDEISVSYNKEDGFYTYYITDGVYSDDYQGDIKKQWNFFMYKN